jgi:putative ABC transport system substrate-binding protein
MNLSKQISFGRQILLLILLVVAFVLLSGCNKKTQQEKVYRIGILSGIDYALDTVEGFKAKMTEFGYIEGENIVYDMQTTNFEPEKEKQILNKFVEDKVDLIFTFPTEVSLAAKEATQGTEIPVVFAVANIEEVGLVDSIKQPGGHITGVRYPGPDIALKRFEIMRELVPDAKVYWIPYPRTYPIVKSQLEALHPVAEAAGITLIEFPVDDAAEIQDELDNMSKSGDMGIDAILFLAEPLTVQPDVFYPIGKFAVENNIPAGGHLVSAGEYESLFGVNIDFKKTGQQAAFLCDKVLKGMDAGTLPVISSENFLQFNYRTAQKQGINIGEGLLAMADEIIR